MNPLPIKQNRLRWILFPLLILCASIAHAVDGQRALQTTQEICDFGPRFPGAEGHAKVRQYLVSQIEDMKRVAWEQPFDAELALLKETRPATNIWALPVPAEELLASEKPIILLSAHWDSRPWADETPDGGKREPFVAANDSASAAALVLEIARYLDKTSVRDQLVLAFWDAEDSGLPTEQETFAVGAQYAAKNPPEWFGRVKLGINLDLIAGQNVRLMREQHSSKSAPEAMDRLWKIGRDLGQGIFSDAKIGPIYDDHLPFIEAGTPYIDLIDMRYPYWHRIEDTPDKCSPARMQTIGIVVAEFIRRELR